MSSKTPVDTHGYPDNNPKTAIGISKPQLSLVPPSAIVLCAQAFGDGARKYGPYNWRGNKVSSSIYIDAALRHILSWADGEECAADSGVHHLGHAMACLAILIDGQNVGNLNDNRPLPGRVAELLSLLTVKKT